MMNDKHYLSELSREELKDMILYPSDVWNELYERVAESNGWFAVDAIKEILGDDYQKWTKYDSCSYDWWMHIKEGRYEDILDIDDTCYFSQEDMEEIDKNLIKLRELVKKIDDLSRDDDDYYDKLGDMEDEADKLADEILQIVVKEIKQLEEVDDEQILDEFDVNEWGNEFYYLGDNKSTIYKDYTKSYKTNVKKEQ